MGHVVKSIGFLVGEVGTMMAPLPRAASEKDVVVRVQKCWHSCHYYRRFTQALLRLGETVPHGSEDCGV